MAKGITIRTAVEAFKGKTNYRYSRFKKKTVENLLGQMLDGEKSPKGKEKKAKEIDAPRDVVKHGDTLLTEDSICLAIEETVKSYARDKASAIDIFKVFIQFLKTEYQIEVGISFPEIDITNSFERQMYLAKEWQDSNKTLGQLSEELWVSTRTLDNDFARLTNPKGKDPIKICGKPFIIRETQRYKGSISCTSTVHPFFLTFNLTQVISTLKGLKIVCDDPVLREYALRSAKAIWQQLSPYGKKRILYVSEHLLPDEVDWYRGLENEDRDMFYTEYQCRRTDGAGVLADCLKNGKACIIECATDGEGSVFYSNCRVVPKSYEGEGLTVVCDQGEYRLDLNKVLRSAYTIDELM